MRSQESKMVEIEHTALMVRSSPCSLFNAAICASSASKVKSEPKVTAISTAMRLPRSIPASLLMPSTSARPILMPTRSRKSQTPTVQPARIRGTVSSIGTVNPTASPTPSAIRKRICARACLASQVQARCRGGAVLVFFPRGAIPFSALTACDKSRRLDQGDSAFAELRKRALCLGDQGTQPLLRGVNAEQGNERGLATAGVLGDGLAKRLGVAFRVEQVVGELEGLAEGRGVGDKRRSPRRIGSAQHRAGLTGEAEQGSGLERLHPRDPRLIQATAFGGEIERLAEHHALPAGSIGKEQDKLGANFRVRTVTRVAHDLES